MCCVSLHPHNNQHGGEQNSALDMPRASLPTPFACRVLESRASASLAASRSAVRCSKASRGQETIPPASGAEARDLQFGFLVPTCSLSGLEAPTVLTSLMVSLIITACQELAISIYEVPICRPRLAL